MVGPPNGFVISNQGSVDSDQTVPEPTDVDGVDANGDQPTEIPVGGPPNLDQPLYVPQNVVWLNDGDGSGDITPGDTLAYTYVITNMGDMTLTGVTLDDVIPNGLTHNGNTSITGAGNAVNVVGSAISGTIPSLAPGESVTVTVEFTVDGPPLFDTDADLTTETFVTQAVADSNETESVLSDGNGDPLDGNQPTSFVAVDGVAGAPLMDVEKRWSLAVDGDGDGLVDPNDTLEYTITVVNSGSAPADNVQLDDAIPANTSLVVGSVTTSQGIVVTEDPIAVNIGDVDPGTLVTVIFRVTVDGGTPDGTILENQATASGDNFADEDSDDNGNDNDGINPTLTPVDAGGGAGSPVGLVLDLVDSTEASTAGNDGAIGEIVTLQLEVTVPPGVLNQAELEITLPTGLTYIAGSSQLARNFDTGLSASNDPGGINSEPAGSFVPLVDGSELDINGQVLSVLLGDVINSDNDGNGETYTLEIQALVDNIGGNQAGADLTAQGTLNYLNALSQPQSLTPDDETVNVVEPTLTIDVSPDPTAILTTGGDVTYTITVTNPGGADSTTAFDANILNSLPPEFTGMTVDSIVPAGGAAGITDNSAGTTVDVDVASIPPGGSVVITVTGTAPGPLPPGTITDTGTVTWTSLPGTNGTGGNTPGAPGDVDGERDDSGGTNDYSAQDMADIVVEDVNLTKTITSGMGRYAVGDLVDYQVVIDVPPTAVLTSSVFTDVLDEGLTYVTGTLNLVYSMDVSSTGNPLEFVRTDDDPMAGQETLTLNFGTLSNSGAATGTVTLTYQALVDNILVNQNNQTDDNNVALNFDDPGGGPTVMLTDSASITIGEPIIALTHTITSPLANLDAGDTVDFEVFIENTGTTTSFETLLQNLLPTGLENISGLMVTASTGGAEIPILTNNGTDWISSGFDLPPGATLTLTFSADLEVGVIPGQQIQNTVDVSFTSRDGVDANERDGSDAGSVQTDGNLNNYNDSANSQTITVADPIALDKRFQPDPANTTYTLGETVTYRLTLQIIEGTLDDLVVTDTLPVGVRFLASSLGVGNVGITTNYGGAPMEAGQVLTFDLGQVVNPANGNDADDFITIDIDVIVEDVPANVDGAVLGNNASLEFTGPGGTETRDFDADGGTPGIQPLDLTIVEPDVQIIKSADPTNLPQGDLVTFTLLLDHTAASTADAYDLQVVDTLPTGLTYVPGSASIAPTSVLGQVITFDIAALTLVQDQTSITFQATVDPDNNVGDVLTNNADLTYSSQPGANADERTYMDTDSADVTVAIITFIEANKTVGIVVDGGTTGQVDVGDTLEYTVTLQNTGGMDADNAVFTDPIPVNTTYVAGSLTSNVGGEDDSDPNNLVVNIGTMLSGATVTITFRVTVDGGTPTGFVISNQGSVDSDQTVPEPTDVDGVDANGDQPTEIPVGGPPNLDQPLYVPQNVVWLNDGDGSGDITPGDTLAYTYVITNMGDMTLTGVTLDDVIPNGLTHNGNTSITGVGNAVNVVGNAISGTIPSLGPGESVTVTVEFTVDGPPLFDTDADLTTETFVTQAVADSNETDSVLSDGNGDPLDGNQPTSFVAVDGVAGAPLMDVEKRWSLAVDGDGDGLVDPTDTLEYTVTLRNSGSAPGDNVQLDDPIPANTSLVVGSVTTSQGIVVTEDPIAVNIGDVDPGTLVTVIFRVTVDGGTADGTILSNQATASGDNFADEDSDDNGDDNDGINPTLTPVDAGGGAGSPGGLDFRLVNSSESSTTDPTLTIGEIATFELEVDIPPGVLEDAVLTITLPPGLTYQGGTSQLARVFETGLSASLDPGAINGEPSGSFVPLADGSEAMVAGQVITVPLGDLINSDNDGNDESYLLRIDALVDNIVGNQAGSALTAQGTLSYLDGLGQPQMLTPDDETVDVVEPQLTITNDASPTAILTTGGDVTYTMVIENPGGAFGTTAFDANITNLLPPEFAGMTVDSIVPSGGIMGVTDNSAGTAVDVTVDVFPPGETLTITVTGNAPGPLPEGTINDTATVTWTSLPGLQGTGDATPGNPGDADGERTGTGGLNDYSASDDADVVVGDLNLTKTIDNPKARYAVGDVVSYRIEITMPATKVANNALLEDILADGLTYVSGSLMVAYDAGMTSSLNPTEFSRTDDAPMPGQETLALDLGTLANGSGGSVTAVFTYEALVDNQLSNQDNQMLPNMVSLTFDDPGTGVPVTLNDDEVITVGEPHLAVSLGITSPTLDLDAGDTIDYELTVTNDGTTTAFETVLQNLLPAGLENISGLMVTVTSGGSETPVLINNGGDWTTDPFDIPPGGSVTISFSAEIADSVAPGDTLQNSVSAAFTSRDGSDGNERDGSDPNSNQDDDSDLNNYNETATAPVVTVADPIALDKAFHPDPAGTTYTIGEVITYRLTLQLIEGTKTAVMVVDTLPAGLRFESAAVGLGNLGITTGYGGAPMENGLELTFDLGSVSNPANGDDSDDFITIDIDAVVENVAGNQDGTVLSNNAEVRFNGPGGPEVRPFDADAMTPGIQGLEATVVLPELALTKMVDNPAPFPGEEIEFTLTVSHTVGSNADAFESQVTDTLPLGLTYILGSGSPTPIVNGSELIFDIPSLTLMDGSIQLTYRVRVEPDVEVGLPLQNTAVATYSTRPGDNPDERTGDDGMGGLNDRITAEVSETVIPTSPVLDATKTGTLQMDADGDGLVSPGDTIRYEMVVENSGNAASTNTSFADSLEANLMLVVGSVTTTQGSVIIGNGAGDTSILVDLAVLPAGASATVTFDAVIVNPVPAATVAVVNQGTVSADDVADVPTDDPGTADEDDPTVIPLVASAQLSATKTDSLFDDADGNGFPSPGDTLEYTIVVTNDGNRGAEFTLVNDILEPNLTLVWGSVTTTQGTVVTGNNPLDISIEVDAGIVPGGGASFTVSFQALIENPLPAGVTHVSNQAIVTADGEPAVTSDDPRCAR